MKKFLVLLIFFVSEVSAQTNCLSITSSDQYFSSSAQGETVDEAKIAATSSLISQISSYVSTRTDLTTMIENKVAQQNLLNLSSSISNLRLDGLRFEICPQSKKGGKLVTVVAYISKVDLEKSANYVAEEVRSYMNMIQDKKALDIAYMSDVYMAYLNTFFSPYPIDFNDGNLRIENLKNYLEREIRNYLNGLELSFTFVEEDLFNLQDHFNIGILIKNSFDSNLKFDLEIPALNARTKLDYNKGNLPVIFRPVSSLENFKGRLSIKSDALPDKLAEVAKNIMITREIEFQVDFSPVIKIDFSFADKGSEIKLTPQFKNISVRNIEWFSNGKLINREQSPTVPKSQIDNLITLKINRQDNLSITKSIGGSVYPRAIEQQRKSIDKSQSIIVDKNVGAFNGKTDTWSIENGFSSNIAAQLTDFNSLKTHLDKLRNEGKVVYGRKTDFINPSSCWVVLINPENASVSYILEPFSDGRNDIKTGKRIKDFESQLKGLIAVWVEFY